MLVSEHIPGRENAAADALSQNDTHTFRSRVPSANGNPNRDSL